LNNYSSQAGFTLIELIVVMFIISLLFVFALPDLSHRIMRDDTELAINRIIQNIQKLKQESAAQNKDLYMCFQMANNIVSMGEISDEDQISDPESGSSFTLTDNISIENIIFSDNRTNTETKPCIGFYKKGYSDWAVIHLSTENGKPFSLVVHAFLHKIQTHEGYVEFD
jgi:prepilin-type N-terminal cleavage/methylation domain-containing protein